MPTPTFSVPEADGPTSVEEPKIITALAAIKDLLSGNLDADNFSGANTATEDTQSANITATGVLTGISISPGAGTYLAIASAKMTNGAAADRTASISLRVGGTNEVNGVGHTISAGLAVGMGVHGIITPSASQAVQVYGTITGASVTVASGRLTLVKLL